MRFYIRQKVFSIGDKYDIKDYNGQTQYTAAGKIFTLGSKIFLYDNIGNECAYIEQELFRLMPRYNIYLRGERNPSAYVAGRFRLLTAKMDIETPIGPMVLEGDYFHHNYYLSQNGRDVMRVRKEWLSWGDTYEIDISDDQDHEMMLAIMIAIDNAYHNEKD